MPLIGEMEMKKLLLTILALTLWLSACAGPAAVVPTPLSEVTPAAPSPTHPPPTAINENEIMARGSALEALAKILGVPMADIITVSQEKVEWADGCLGIVYINALCAAVITPGYRLVLEAEGVRYVYHTNADGTLVKAAQTEGLPISEIQQRTARETLANALGLLDYTNVVVISAEMVEWPDSCLGAAQPGMACLEVITPGVLIKLKEQGLVYEYHTNADGSLSAPASIALTWRREGGLAGFCDELVIYLAGEVRANTCGGDNISGYLTPDELAQLHQWLANFNAVALNNSDAPPGSADAMTIELTLNGLGRVEAAEADQQILTAWAQTVYVRVTTSAVES